MGKRKATEPVKKVEPPRVEILDSYHESIIEESRNDGEVINDENQSWDKEPPKKKPSFGQRVIPSSVVEDEEPEVPELKIPEIKVEPNTPTPKTPPRRGRKPAVASTARKRKATGVRTPAKSRAGKKPILDTIMVSRPGSSAGPEQDSQDVPVAVGKRKRDEEAGESFTSIDTQGT